MMSAEYPEIIPEPFNYPCASYNGNAEDFINDVVENCHSSYHGLTYTDATCPQLSTHHSLLLQELTAGQDHHLLRETQDRESQGRSSYSCETNVHILVKEPTLCVDASTATTVVCCSPEDQHIVEEGDAAMGGVTWQVECSDGSKAAPALKRSQIIEENLLAAKPNESPPPSLNGDYESGGCLTPTPSYDDQLTTPTMYAGNREIAGCGVRGGDVAKLDEGHNTSTADNSKSEVEQNCEETNQVVGLDDVEVNLMDRRTTPYDRSPANWLAPVIQPLSKRRSGSTLLQHLPAAYHVLPIPPTEIRKLSDSAVCMRREKFSRTARDLRKQRCLSDSEAPTFSYPVDEDEERESSALGCDSGFQDDKGSRFHEGLSAHYSSPRVSLQSLDLLSQDEGSEVYSRTRRVTPLPVFSQEGSQSDDTSGVYQSSSSGNPGTMVHPRERTRRSLMKHYSQGSISGISVGGASLAGTSSIGASSESPSLSSILDCQSNITGVTDLLSSLGFDDFESPQLVPDRFIPKDLEYLRPSSMKLAFIEQSITLDLPRSPDSLASGQSSNQPQLTVRQTVAEPSDLPLGATAENFLDYNARPGSPVPDSLSEVPPDVDEPHAPGNDSGGTPLFTDTKAIMDFTMRTRFLETVPEETASDLSPSPRWFSPRVSIDHSVHLDLAEGKLGASLNVQKVRKRSLPSNRDGYRWSIGSLGDSDTGDSIHLSVTSYDDMIAAEREKERENLPPVACDDTVLSGARRRRKGVYNPPQTLLSWLSTQKTIDEEEDTDPDELPWPFSEQARLRKSLTEISLAQKNSLAESQLENGGDDNCGRNTSNSQSGSQRDIMSVSPMSTPNTRLSPQPAISDDEDGDLQTSDVVEHSYSHYHKDELARVSSPTSSSDRFLSSSDFMLSSGPELNPNNSSGLEYNPNNSTTSLLQTERGSLVTLSSDHSPTGSLRCTDILHDETVSQRTTSIPLESRACMKPAGGIAVSTLTHHGMHSSSTLIPPTNTFKEDCKYPLPRMQEDTLFSSHTSSELRPSEEPATDTVPEEHSKVGRKSDDQIVLCKESPLHSLPASHIELLQSCSLRRQKFAERRAKSLEESMPSLPSPVASASTGRVRRKAVYGNAPPSATPFTEQFLLSPTRGDFSRELKEVEKYMIL